MIRTQKTYLEQDKVRHLFEKYDLNKNGVLDREEFLKIMIDILNELGEEIPQKRHIEVAEEGMDRFDLNENGKIEFNEFYEFINFLVSEKGYTI